jgi:F0F1-type ATP synthase membrane subunit c/vacuolar-type H+-ATPase subunit K
MSVSTLPRAPGASTAKTTGILSLVLGPICLPVGLVLAIVALVQQRKATRAVAESPGAFQPVGRTGFVTAIVGLVLSLTLATFGMVAGMIKMNGNR